MTQSYTIPLSHGYLKWRGPCLCPAHVNHYSPQLPAGNDGTIHVPKVLANELLSARGLLVLELLLITASAGERGDRGWQRGGLR